MTSGPHSKRWAQWSVVARCDGVYSVLYTPGGKWSLGEAIPPPQLTKLMLPAAPCTCVFVARLVVFVQSNFTICYRGITNLDVCQLLTHFTWHHQQNNPGCAILVFNVNVCYSVMCAFLGDVVFTRKPIDHQHGERGISRRVWRACKGSTCGFIKLAFLLLRGFQCWQVCFLSTPPLCHRGFSQWGFEG